MIDDFLWFMAGAVTMLFVRWLVVDVIFSNRQPKPPPPPECPAVLQTGEQCIYGEGHEGHHRARVFAWGVGMYGNSVRIHQSDYCWEDPECGVHAMGFFPRKQ